MTREEMLNKLTEIGTCEDVTDRISMLTSLSDEVGKVFDNIDGLNNTITTLNQETENYKTSIAKLQEVNMDLFKRVGANNQNSTPNIPSGNEGDGDEDTKLKFEDLFKKGDEK